MPPCSNRSPVPDLLFDDVQQTRLEEIGPYLADPCRLDARLPLHRVTVFTTFACNLACEYCKTMTADPRQYPAAFDLASFRSMLARLDPTPVRHIHFTGGEAGLVRDLPGMVALARRRGVPGLSITSNGSLPPPFYRTLVESGLNEVRITLSARDAGTGELLAGREQAWDRAVASVRLLTGLRDAGWPLFVIVNTVISERNRMDADNIVDFLLSLGIDDMKLITVVQRKEDLGNFPEAERVVDGVRRALARYPEASLPLLRRKLQTVFSPDAIGLDAVPPDPAWRCYIPLTERTVDSLHYYPCSVYRREGGAPLGSVVEPQRVQMAKSIDFVLNGDCTSDPICRRYCLHCTRTFNVNANILARSPRADGRPPSTSI